jgi:GT2 family glycosyltransferase
VRLSVIIPVRNAAPLLERCLQALLRSDGADFECIVVDDASTDDTSAVAAQYPVSVISLERRHGPAGARNRGALEACGEVLVFIDSDVCLHPDTLRRIAAHLGAHPETAAVFGSYDDTPADPHFLSQYKNLLHHYVHQHSRSDAWTFWAGCGAIRRELFLGMGGFDESYTRPSVEDIELGGRLRALGQRVDLNAEIQVTHLKRWTLAGLLRADLFDRAIPWLRIMLRDRTLPADLNLTMQHRLSVISVWLMALTTLAVTVAPTQRLMPLALMVVVLCGATLLWLNLDVYRFFARKRGLGFAIKAVPMHWLYAWYCGLAVPMALIAHSRAKLAGPRAALAPGGA